MSDIIKIKEEYITKLNQDIDLNQVNQFKTELFGKNGKISNEFKKMGSIPDDVRKRFASDLNAIKDEIQNLISKKTQEIEKKTTKTPLQDTETLTLANQDEDSNEEMPEEVL